MEHIEKIKKAIQKIKSVLTLTTEQNSEKPFSLFFALEDKLKVIEEEVTELEKIQNYTKASTTSTKENLQKEMVNHPSHYKNGNIECIEAMIDVFGKDKVAAFCELNAFKYQWRANNKGTDIQDKKKAIWYLNKYIKLNKKES
jgi:hypothetical protein